MIGAHIGWPIGAAFPANSSANYSQAIDLGFKVGNALGKDVGKKAAVRVSFEPVLGRDIIALRALQMLFSAPLLKEVSVFKSMGATFAAVVEAPRNVLQAITVGFTAGTTTLKDAGKYFVVVSTFGAALGIREVAKVIGTTVKFSVEKQNALAVFRAVGLKFSSVAGRNFTTTVDVVFRVGAGVSKGVSVLQSVGIRLGGFFSRLVYPPRDWDGGGSAGPGWSDNGGKQNSWTSQDEKPEEWD